MEDETHKEASHADGDAVGIDKIIKKDAPVVDESESGEKVEEGPKILGIIENVNCDFEEGRIALSYPVDDAVDPRLDPIPAAGNPVNCDFEALSYPVDYTDDPRLDPIPAASNLVQHLTVSCIISADRYFDAVRD